MPAAPKLSLGEAGEAGVWCSRDAAADARRRGAEAHLGRDGRLVLARSRTAAAESIPAAPNDTFGDGVWCARAAAAAAMPAAPNDNCGDGDLRAAAATATFGEK